MTNGTLTLFCGKMGTGKSTLAKKIARETGAVLISEDAWLAALYPDQIGTVAEYVAHSNRLKPPVKTLVQSILSTGADLVLDFPANTTGQREWLRSISDEIGAAHVLHFIDAPDDVCLNNIKKRAAKHPDRQKTDTAEMFYALKPYFSSPSVEEAMTVVRH